MANKRPAVWICRGDKCGSKKKVPGVAHKALLKLAKREGEDAGVKVKVTDCQGACGQGNVVVARSGGVIRWFRKMNDEESTRALLGCVAACALDNDLPPCLQRRVMPKRDGRKPKQ